MKLGETREFGHVKEAVRRAQISYQEGSVGRFRQALSLEEKSDREDLIKHLLRGLEASSSSGRSAKAKKGKGSDTTPIKETKLPVVGD